MDDEELAGMPAVDRRDVIVSRVENEMDKLFLERIAEHGLTYAERFSILSGMLASCAKFALRAERDHLARRERAARKRKEKGDEPCPSSE